MFSILEEYTDEFTVMEGPNKREYQLGRWIQKDTSGKDMTPEMIYEMAEDIFYEVGMNAEHRAVQYIQTHTRFTPSVQGNDFIQLKQYMRIMKNGSVDEAPAIGYMLSLMDSGLLAMNMELNHSRKQMQCITTSAPSYFFNLISSRQGRNQDEIGNNQRKRIVPYYRGYG